MNGYVYAVGGCDSWNCLNSVERYDPATNSWTSVSPLNTARRGCGVAVYNGKFYLFLHTIGVYDKTFGLKIYRLFERFQNVNFYKSLLQFL